MGGVYMAAQRIGCSHVTIQNWIKRSPDVAAVVDHWRGRMLDIAEANLFLKVQRGEPWAIAYVLRMLGQTRGYHQTKQLEHTGNVGAPTTFADWIKIETQREQKKEQS